MSDQLALRQKLQDFADYLFPVVDRFPKSEKFALSTQIKNTVYGLLRLTVRMHKSRDRLRWLFEIDVELEYLRFLVRHAHSRRFLSSRRLQVVALKVSEIGRILGGLIKAQKGARP